MIICNYILTEQTEINIKNSTKEGKIKVLVWLSNYFNDETSFKELTKLNILDYLNSLRKSYELDPRQKWIGSYNNRQMILTKFFKWFYNQDESDTKKRLKGSLSTKVITLIGINPQVKQVASNPKTTSRITLVINYWFYSIINNLCKSYQ